MQHRTTYAWNAIRTPCTARNVQTESKYRLSLRRSNRYPHCFVQLFHSFKGSNFRFHKDCTPGKSVVVSGIGRSEIAHISMHIPATFWANMHILKILITFQSAENSPNAPKMPETHITPCSFASNFASSLQPMIQPASPAASEGTFSLQKLNFRAPDLKASRENPAALQFTYDL